jgi:hypothetical protein
MYMYFQNQVCQEEKVEEKEEGEGEKEGKGEDEEEVPLQLHSSPVSSTPLVIVVDSLIRGSSL